ENGKTISDQVVKSGNVGDEYSTEQKNIDGYTFKEVQGNATGTFTADRQTVTYVYTKNSKAPEKPVTPDSPEKPVIPDNGKTGSKANNNTTANNTTTNNVVKTVKKSVEKMLPKTAAEKVGFSAILAIILAGVTGVVVFKSRRNTSNN
ncbi:MucBP domain-containing protein, partial [Leuconostoc citreum]